MTVYCNSSGCPAPELIKPCVCVYKPFEGNRIRCGGHSDIDLVNIFQTLEKNLNKTEKHFSWFELNDRIEISFEYNRKAWPGLLLIIYLLLIFSILVLHKHLKVLDNL